MFNTALNIINNMIKSLCVSCLLLLQYCGFYTHAQHRRIPFEHIGIAEGLSESNILTIAQDEMGFMWFGTWDGLNKYDGYKITVYKNLHGDSNSISNNYINKIAPDRKGNLWVATNDGLNCFNLTKEKFNIFKHIPGNANSISGNVINAVLPDRQGRIWIGTDKGLDCYYPSKNKFEHLFTLPSSAGMQQSCGIKNIYEDSQGNLWFCNMEDKGVALLQNKDHTFLYFSNNSSPVSLGGNNVNVIFEDSRHRIWLGTNGRGFDLYDMHSNTFRHFRHDDNKPNSIAKDVVLAINEDEQHNIWISTENGGISIFNYETGTFTNYQHDEIDKESISNNSVYCLYKDNKGNMWLGNFAGWVDIAISDKLLFTHYKHNMSDNSLTNNQVLSIVEDRQKKLWIGTDGGGLDLFDPRSGTFTHFRHEINNPNSICGNNVLNTLEDSKGNIWIGTWVDGVTVLNPAHKVIRHFKFDPADPSSLSNNNAWKIFEDRDKRIWIGTYGGGLNLLNPDGKSFTRFQRQQTDSNGIHGENIVNIFEDREGLLWLSTESSGLDVYDREKQRFTHFLHTETGNSISNNNVNSVFEDSQGNIWIGTMHGLNLYNKKTGKFILYTKESGLAGDYVFGLLEDDNKNLWISTNHGISRFSPETGVFENYSVEDGVQSNEFKIMATCKASTGLMYFGGINGFNEFTPGRIKRKVFNPPLVITSFSVFNKKLPIASEGNPSPLQQSISKTTSITLPYTSSVLSIEFASLNYTGSGRKRYFYMLEGFDKDWLEAGMSRSVTYTNLDPGTYTFKVRGLNNEGKPTANYTALMLIITPPYWHTWWFRITVVLLAAGAVFAFYRYRVKAIERQKTLLQKQVKKQTLALQMSAIEERNAREAAERAQQAISIANTELEKSERRYSALFYDSPLPKWVYDTQSLLFTQVNHAAVALYGFSKEEFLTMKITDLIHHPPGPVHDVTSRVSAADTTSIIKGRHQHIKKTKEIIDVDVHTSIINLNNKEYGLLLVMDITEKLKLENKLEEAIIKTQEEERYEIGSELHDNIGQILVSSQMNISMLGKSVSESQMPFFERARLYISQALIEIRNLSHRLAPTFHDESSLEEAFNALADSINTGKKYEISIHFFKSVKERLIRRDVQLHLYRILQEQLRNIVKHADASSIYVDLMINDYNELLMETSDDGIGFDPSTVKNGIGMANIQRRAALFKGRIAIDTMPGMGCCYTIAIPSEEAFVAQLLQ